MKAQPHPSTSPGLTQKKCRVGGVGPWMPSADVVGAGDSGPADLHKTHFYNILGWGGQWPRGRRKADSRRIPRGSRHHARGGQAIANHQSSV